MKTITLTFMLGIMMSIGSAQEPQRSSSTIDLNMMDQCIDDKFSKCISEMEEQVQKVYFPREIKNKHFKTAWDKSAECATKKLQRMQNSKLTINQTRAICVYTEKKNNIYIPLNTALRTDATYYNTSTFQYHALYFWLTTALQILKSCRTTYRRTEDMYNGHVNQIIRFGHFTSSSLKPDLKKFGSETCFCIETCLGAPIKEYSQYPEEEEVLIPSYEKFKITKIVQNSFGELKCRQIFVLESVGHSSKLNCKATNRNQEMKANLALIIGFQLLTGLTLNKYSYI